MADVMNVEQEDVVLAKEDASVQEKSDNPLDAMVRLEWYLADYLTKSIFQLKIQDGDTVYPVKQLKRGIALAYPLANIWYVMDETRGFAKLLNLSMDDVKRVVYCAARIVISSEVSDVKAGQVVSEKDAQLLRQEHGVAIVFGIGAEGLEQYASAIGVPLPGMMHYFPVFLPIQDRMDGVDEELKKDIDRDLQHQYCRLNFRNERLKRLIGIGAPEIILLNERRMLQEYMDSLLENGLRGKPYTYNDGTVYHSFADLIVKKGAQD